MVRHPVGLFWEMPAGMEACRAQACGARAAAGPHDVDPDREVADMLPVASFG